MNYIAFITKEQGGDTHHSQEMFVATKYLAEAGPTLLQRLLLDGAIEAGCEYTIIIAATQRTISYTPEEVKAAHTEFISNDELATLKQLMKKYPEQATRMMGHNPSHEDYVASGM